MASDNTLGLLTGRYDPGKDAPAPSPSSGGIAGATRNDEHFHSRPRMNHPLLDQKGTPMTRGFMTSPSGIKPRITLNFMYNPNEIRTAYDTDQSKMMALETIQKDDPASIEGVPMLVGGASMSFALFFDRTVEVASRGATSSASRDGKSSPRDLGVLHDLGVLERLVGALGSGQIVSNPTEVHFTRGTKGPALNFRGYIVGAETIFDRFNQHMIPQHATVSIVMRRIFIPNPVTPNASEGSDKQNMPQNQTATPNPAETNRHYDMSGRRTYANP